jgi:hypothetical protein
MTVVPRVSDTLMVFSILSDLWIGIERKLVYWDFRKPSVFFFVVVLACKDKNH